MANRYIIRPSTQSNQWELVCSFPQGGEAILTEGPSAELKELRDIILGAKPNAFSLEPAIAPNV